MPLIWVIFFVIFVNMLGFGVIIPLAPTFQATFHLTSLQYGIFGAIFPLVQMFSAPILGRLSDRVGRRPVMLTSFLLLSFSYLVLAFAKSYPMLLVSRIIGGFFSGSFVVAMACSADISDHKNRRQYIGIASMGFGFGFMLGPTIGGILAGPDTLHARVLETGLFAFSLSIIGTILILVSLKETLKQRHTVVTSIFQEIIGIFKKREDFVNFFLSSAVSMVLAGIEVFLSLALSKNFSFSPQNIGVFWGVFAIVMTFGRTALLKILHGYKGMMSAFFIIGIATICYTVVSNIWAIHLLSAVIALFSGALITLVNSSISLNADPNQQGLFLGLSNSAGNLGRTIAPYIMGFIIQKANNNIQIGWFFPAFICILAIIGAYSIYLKQKRNPSVL